MISAVPTVFHVGEVLIYSYAFFLLFGLLAGFGLTGQQFASVALFVAVVVYFLIVNSPRQSTLSPVA